jgi:beta-N-acetylhexosaminidase
MRTQIAVYFIFIALSLHATSVEEILSTLTLEQKIGQLFIVSSNSHKEAGEQLITVSTIDEEYLEHCVKTYHIGGVVFLGRRTALEQIRVTEHLQRCSTIPLLIALDAEWGLGMRLTDCIEFPHAMTLGAITDNNLIYEMGLEIGRQCKIMGVHINLAPVADVNTDPENPIIGTRSFGDNPTIVGEKSQAYARGLMDGGVMSCAKHFPGHGNTHVDSHYLLPVINSTFPELMEIELAPFVSLIKAGIPAIMTGHIAVPAVESDITKPATFSHALVSELLRTQLGFDGLILTDSLLMKSATAYAPPRELELQALLAGNDLILCPTDIPAAVKYIREAVVNDILSEQELDMHVRRILAAKEWIFTQQGHPTIPSEKYLDTLLHTPKAYALQKTLYAQAATLVYDAHHLLPLNPDAPYYIIAPPSQDSAYFVDALQKVLPHANLVTLTDLDSGSTTIPVIVPIIGNSAYRQNLPADTLALIQEIASKRNPLILVLCTSPYLLSKLPQADACIIVYEGNKAAQQAAVDALITIEPLLGILPIEQKF